MRPQAHHHRIYTRVCTTISLSILYSVQHRQYIHRLCTIYDSYAETHNIPTIDIYFSLQSRGPWFISGCPLHCNIYLLWVYCGSLYMSHILCMVYICIGGVGQMSMIVCIYCVSGGDAPLYRISMAPEGAYSIWYKGSVWS